MDHLTFSQQVIMALLHGGVPSALILTVGALILRGQRRHAEMHNELNDGFEDRIKQAVAHALQRDSIGE